VSRHTLNAEESVELIHQHGLYRLVIEAGGREHHVAIVADGQVDLEDALTREYGEWKLVRDKAAA
jgi:hypothetical protein